MTRIVKLPSALFAILTLLSASACPPPTSVFDPSATTTTTSVFDPSATTTTTATAATTTTTAGGGSSSTTTTTTTTTVSTVTTTSVSSTSSSSTSSTSSTSTTLATPSYNVSLSIDSNVGLVGGMALTLNFTGPTGSFDVTSGTTADCSDGPGNLMLANRDLPGTVLLAWIDVNGFTTPTALASCRLSSTAAITSADFNTTVTEAVDDLGGNIVPLPVATVSVALLP